MILSISRRTDIPAFYSEWLMRRLRQGEVLVRNPMNYHQVGRIVLDSRNTSCLVFWSKNPGPLLAHLPEIDVLGYRSFFLFTLNAYGDDVEAHLPPLSQRLDTFRCLARLLGKDGVIWRYDPIFFNRRYTLDFHRQAFASLAASLGGYTERCIVSFIEMYKKCRRNMVSLAPGDISLEDRLKLLLDLRDIARTHHITLQSCAASEELRSVITPGQCIDGELLAKRFGTKFHVVKDKHQRTACGCNTSIDIGAYHSCPHGCLYCYANHNLGSAQANFAAHNPDSPLLLGNLGDRDLVKDRTMPSIARGQHSLFQKDAGNSQLLRASVAPKAE
jgi:Domain of unknown function (DUF1848)